MRQEANEDFPILGRQGFQNLLKVFCKVRWGLFQLLFPNQLLCLHVARSHVAGLLN